MKFQMYGWSWRPWHNQIRYEAFNLIDHWAGWGPFQFYWRTKA